MNIYLFSLKNLLAGVLAFWLAAGLTQAAQTIDAARVAEIAKMLPVRPTGFGEPITNRTAWGKIVAADAFPDAIWKAEKLTAKPITKLTDRLYLDYSRTGNRKSCEAVLTDRANRIAVFTLAECLENKGRFIRPLVEAIVALDSERTWVMPAHDGKLLNFRGQSIDLDLRSTSVGWDLATADYLLGDKLPAQTRQALQENIQRRVLQPFRDMVEGRRPENFWLRAKHNWNSVCLSGVLGAALAIEDSANERAWFIAATDSYIHYYLDGFAADGYCFEGIGYWNYGFGRYVMFSELIRQATGNRLDPLAEPSVLQPALYGTRTEILNDIYPSIADSHPGGKPDPKIVRFISERLGLKLSDESAADFAGDAGGLAASVMFTFLPQKLPVVPHPAMVTDSPLRTWFNYGGVLICRPATNSNTQFAVAIKGGHNGENHGHNDLGSFSVVAGKSMVICDPGGEVYTKRTFSSHRFDSKVLNSYGHSVPLVAGALQSSGTNAEAKVLQADFSAAADTLALDLKSAYPINDLKQLKRTFVYHRNKPTSFTVTDEVAFTRPKSFETALITWGKVENISDDELLISDDFGAVRVTVDTGGQPFKVSEEVIDEDVPTDKKPTRIRIALKSAVTEARIRTTISPTAKSDSLDAN